MTVQNLKDVITSDVNTQIQYEWVVLQECLDRKFIRGMYASLERLLKLYKKRDIKL